MAFVALPSSKAKRRKPIALSIEDVASCFLSDDQSIFDRFTRSRGTSDSRTCEAPARHLRYYPALGIVYGTVDAASLDRLLTTLPIKHVSGPLATSLIRPIDRLQLASPTQAVTWGISTLNIPALWNRGFTGKSIAVGHLDSGVDITHPTLRNAVRAFAFIDEGGEIDTFQTQAFDSDDHGTHTAATIAGRESNGKRVGVAPAAELHSAVVIEGGLTQVRILAGMEWALAQGVRIVNISLGVRGFTEDFHPLTRRMREAGVFPVFAVGNEGVNSSRAPGNYNEALSVGAVDESGAVASFSSSDEIGSGRFVPDLVAPGRHVQSALAGGGYLSMSGTSMSAPHLAGLAALLLEANPEASVDRLEQAIFASCRTSPSLPANRAGLGVPDAEVAMQNILN